MNRTHAFLFATVLLLGGLALVAGDALSQEGYRIIPSKTEKMIQKLRYTLVRGGQPLSTRQWSEVTYNLRPKLEEAEDDLHKRYRKVTTWLVRKRSDINRYAENGQYRKQQRAQEDFNREYKKLDAIFEKKLGEVQNDFLKGVLTAKQRALLGIEDGAGDDKPEKEPEPSDTGRRLRESDFY